ncbi:thiamine ABC transporter ATP-binding protein [Chelativorans salis]|uniref:Thiamine ABC transporter ATP-binding protein n=1 Tax=Chelativorans salis TaxID=2978478 RepID=A0ABT2LPW1_9HYPH|nr:thiamine ABC transporter ATP-binding protein [Chelativorans sp. EGI FJ00035]MCT7376597.1 thiamine ABC transporter ATP-binding protein [Chelativorans sp. EGI FJ00035]
MTRYDDPGGGAIRLEALRFAYPGGAVMRFDLRIEASDIVALMGPSGSGKSTLLNLIAGFEAPNAGRVMIGSEDVTGLPPHRRPVSMVFQENNLFAHLTVAQNVGLGRSPGLRLSKADQAAVMDALARTGLAGKEERLPHALSGGERQRVALARVLVRERPVLLLDEPFASLGPALRDEMLDLIAGLHRDQAMTILMTTHDPRDAERLSKTLVFLENGAIAGAGATAEFLSGGGSAAFDRYLGARKAPE